MDTFLANLIITALVYLAVPLLICAIARYQHKYYTLSTIRKIVIFNGIGGWLLFRIMIIESGGDPGSGATVFLWSAIAYATMKRLVGITPQATEFEVPHSFSDQNGEETEPVHLFEDDNVEEIPYQKSSENFWKFSKPKKNRPLPPYAIGIGIAIGVIAFALILTYQILKTENEVYVKTHTYTVSTYVCYTTDTGDKYHAGYCQYLSKSANKTTVYEAKQDGYSACSKCTPYQETSIRVLDTEGQPINPATGTLFVFIVLMGLLGLVAYIFFIMEKKDHEDHEDTERIE